MERKKIRGFARYLIAPATIAVFVASTAISAADTFVFVNRLLVGSRGIEVRNLQQFMTSQGVYNGPITGYFGPLTRAGVENFQTKYDIEAVGEVGPKTRGKLNELAIEADIQDLKQQISDLRAKLAALQGLPSAPVSTSQSLQDQINGLQGKIDSLTATLRSGGQGQGGQAQTVTTLPTLPTTLQNVNVPGVNLQSALGTVAPTTSPLGSSTAQIQQQLNAVQAQLNANPNMSLQGLQTQMNTLNQIQTQMNTQVQSALSQSTGNPVASQLQGQFATLQSIQNQISSNPNMSLQDLQNLIQSLNQLQGQLSPLPNTSGTTP